MNWGQFKKNVGARVQIEPPLCRLDELNRLLPERSDDWLVEAISETSAMLANTATGHKVELGKDHIFDFRSNPGRSKAGITHGFLVLKMQVFTRGAELWLRPNSRPGERVAHAHVQRHAPAWSPFIKVDASSFVPSNAAWATIQYKLASSEPGIPLLIRIASKADGAITQELSGPSGVVEQMLIETQTFYVSVSHPQVRYDIGILGYRFNQ